MSDFEKELEQMNLEVGDAPEVPLPSIEEQKAIAAKLKELEAKGELTPEILEEFFGKFNQENQTPVH